MTDDSPHLRATFILADLAMALGQVDRATLHPDGKTHETVTTHTVMLCLVLIHLADELRDRLSDFRIGLALQFALVHDLVEAIAGDVSTLRPLSEEARAAKDKAEREAFFEIRRMLGAHSAIPHLIAGYERMGCVEARVVHYIDKMLPKVTHKANGCAAVIAAGETWEWLQDRLWAQLDALRSTDNPGQFLETLASEVNNATLASWSGK